MFGGAAQLFDGGGASIYWRPLSRQLYFGALGPMMLAHPHVVAGLHGALLATVSVLLYRALRSHWSAPWSAAAASFPLIAEANRTFLLWPTTFQDLGALLGVAIAIHEASRRRLFTALIALLASLLCKESALIGALLLPWIPAIERGERRRWMVATVSVVAVWAVGYALALSISGIQFQRHFEGWRPALPIRLLWAMVATLRDVLGIGAVSARLGSGLATAFGALIVAGLVWAMRSAAGRARLRVHRAWLLWGLTWFVASTALLSEVFPLWGPFRSTFAMVGLGIALTTLLGAAGSAWLGLSCVIRLVLLAASQGPPSAVAQMPYQQAAALDFASLSRVSRFTSQTQNALRSVAPSLPQGAVVSWRLRPQMTQYTFAGNKALHVWYRDTTLSWVSWEDVQKDSAQRLDATLEYQAHERREVVALTPEAVEAFREALRQMNADACSAALISLARADSLQIDRGARSFLGAVAGKRAVCGLAVGDIAESQEDAARSLKLWPEGGDARYVLAVGFAIHGQLDEARAQIDTLLEHDPFDASGLALRDSLRLEARR